MRDELEYVAILGDFDEEAGNAILRALKTGRPFMARKTVLVCDNCGKEVDEGKGGTLRIAFTDARRGAKQADVCDDCAGTMPGKAAARRGRKPKGD